MRALELKLRVSIQDRVWRVRLRDRWLYVLVLLEFQSAVDRTMAVRILAYTALLYQDLLRASSDPLPPVLPIVLYDGSERWREAGTMMNEAVNDWTAPWREEGRAEGRAQGQTEVMRRMAARKFDAGTAERLAERLAEIADPERVAEIGEWLIECEHGDELIQRVERLCGTSAAGDGPSRG